MDQFVDARIAVRGADDQGFLEVSFPQGLPLTYAGRIEFLKNALREQVQITGNVQVIEIDQTGDQIRIGGIDLVVHPAPDEFAQNRSVQVTVNPDHAASINDPDVSFAYFQKI
jgi:hypothetical protein